MLYKNGINLKSGLVEFINKSNQLFIFSAYIKLEPLKYLIDVSDKVKSVCVRWEPRDLITGASDLEIYLYLRDKGVYLYRNPRLHLKAFIDDYSDCFMGSANISNRALDIAESQTYNYEIGTIVKDLSLADRLYFNKIEQESILITDSIYNQLKEQLPEKNNEFPKETEFKLTFDGLDKDFLITALPMSFDINLLYSTYSTGFAKNSIDLNCAVHDLVLYDIGEGLDWVNFKQELSIKFFNHRFIKYFLRKVEERNEIYFGEAKEWIQQNCANVPAPRRWEITENIQILYKWIVDLGDGKYIIDIPRAYSERLRII